MSDFALNYVGRCLVGGVFGMEGTETVVHVKVPRVTKSKNWRPNDIFCAVSN